MVARPGTYQASNNAGELSPEEYGRTDLKQFYSGMAYMRNVEPVPQGGSRLSPRSRHMARLRGRITDIATTSTSSNLGPHVAAAIIFTADFGAMRPVSVVRFLTAASIATGAIAQVELFNGIAWVAFGPLFNIGTGYVGYTAAAPPRTSVSASAVRMRLVSAPPASVTFLAGGLTSFAEDNVLVAGTRLLPFTFSISQTYTVALSHLCADFYRDGVYVGCAITGISESQLDIIDAQQRFDTMLLFHQDVPSRRVIRDGSDARWLTTDVPFRTIPQVDYGATYTNQVVDIWDIYIRFLSSGNNADGKNLIIALNVNGEQSAGIPTGGPTPDWNAVATAMKVAIENLAGVEAGITVTASAPITGSVTITVQFTGEGNKGGRFSVSAQVVNSVEAAATAAHTQIGKPGGEPVMSLTRGWPSAGAFYQDRLVVGGFRSKAGAFLASLTGEYYDLNIELVAATGAILANIDTDGAERLQRLVRGKHLLLFTSDAEYHISDRTLNRTAPPTIVQSSRNGSASDLPIVESEGEIIYVSRNKSVIYAASYDDVAQAYVSSPISLLAAHIASNMNDLALQKPSTAANAARLWMPRADGTMTVGVMLRNQEVTSFVRWWTPGKVRRSCVDGKNLAYLIVERSVGASLEHHLERLDETLVFDDAIEQTFGAPVTVVPNLAAHEGASVWAECDGYMTGPFTVAGASITIPIASTHVIVGRWTPPLARTLPLPSEVSERIVVRRPKRAHTVRLDLLDTTSVAVGANGRPARNRDLARVGDPIDQPTPPASRMEVFTGLTGFTYEGQIEITQTKPGRLAWRGITIEARG